MYLQSRGWYVVPNSRKGNTMRFEFMLACSRTGEKALVQVKTGKVPLNIDSYANDGCRIFLFQSNEHYEGGPAQGQIAKIFPISASYCVDCSDESDVDPCRVRD